jgi:hypothetical protein
MKYAKLQEKYSKKRFIKVESRFRTKCAMYLL